MAVRRPRPRYVAFELARPGIGREVTAAIRAAVATWPKEERPQLLFVEGERGLVRCNHRTKDDVVRLLGALELMGTPAIRTIGTSGTVRRARKKYFGKS